MKIKKTLKWILISVLGTIGIIVSLVLFSVFSLWYQNTYKTELQTIKVPEKNIKFILLTDMSGFDDTSWYVYRIGVNSKLTKENKKAGDTDDVLFWNYSEAGEHKENPHIRFIKSRYLIFNRGKIDHSLYDLTQDKVIVNEHSTWGVVVAKPDIDAQANELDELMDKWAYENLHLRINEYIK